MRLVVMASMVMALLGTWWARPARACSFLPNAVMVDDVPANGVVVVQTRCVFGPCFEGELPDTLDVFEVASGEAVAGALVRTSGTLADSAYMAWKPAEPLVEGELYELRWRPRLLTNIDEERYLFRALPAVDLSASSLEAHVGLERIVDWGSDLIECEAWWVDSCGYSATTVALSERSLVVLDIALGDDTEFGPSFQYAVQSAFWAEGEPEPALGEPHWPVFFLHESGEFDTRADAYCYRFVVESLSDGSAMTQQGCITHGDLGDVTTTAVAEEQLEDTLASCAEPPPQREASWCRGMARACTAAAAEGFERAGCADLAARCSEIIPELSPIPLPPPPDDSFDDMPGDDAPDHLPGHDDQTSTAGAGEPTSKHAEACSVASVGAGSATGGAPWLLTSLLPWARRRRRSRR